MRHPERPIAIALALGIFALAAAFAAEPQKDLLAALDWMVGSWVDDEGDYQSEEHWIAPRGGAMLGLHRDLHAGRMISFEYLRIEQRSDAVYYVASPQGKPGTDFRLVESVERRAVFANPEHDFPQRIIYWLTDDNELHARIEGERNGETSSAEWSWSRQE